MHIIYIYTVLHGHSLPSNCIAGIFSYSCGGLSVLEELDPMLCRRLCHLLGKRWRLMLRLEMQNCSWNTFAQLALLNHAAWGTCGLMWLGLTIHYKGSGMIHTCSFRWFESTFMSTACIFCPQFLWFKVSASHLRSEIRCPESPKLVNLGWPKIYVNFSI